MVPIFDKCRESGGMRWCQRAGPVDPHPYALVGDARSIQNGSKISLGPVDRVSKESNSGCCAKKSEDA